MITNYTGPYLSDGRFQESVPFGTTKPTSPLDALARLHDTAYAIYSDRNHREAADRIFYTEAMKLKTSGATTAAALVKYGNYAGRQASDIIAHARWGPLGLAYVVAQNIKRLSDRMTGSDRIYDKDIEALYATDPLPHLQGDQDHPTTHTTLMPVNEQVIFTAPNEADEEPSYLEIDRNYRPRFANDSMVEPTYQWGPSGFKGGDPILYFGRRSHGKRRKRRK